VVPGLAVVVPGLVAVVPGLVAVVFGALAFGAGALGFLSLPHANAEAISSVKITVDFFRIDLLGMFKLLGIPWLSRSTQCGIRLENDGLMSAS
jgi:hypothetical protein